MSVAMEHSMPPSVMARKRALALGSENGQKRSRTAASGPLLELGSGASAALCAHSTGRRCGSTHLGHRGGAASTEGPRPAAREGTAHSSITG